MATVLFLVTIYLISFRMLRVFSLETAEEVAFTILDGTDNRIRSLFGSFEALAVGLAGTRAVTEVRAADMRDLFISSVLAWKRYIRAIYLGTADGRMYEWGHGLEFVDYTPTFPPGYDPRQRPWYQAALAADGFSVSPPYRFASVNDLGITCVYQVRDAQGSFVGVIGLDILLKNLKSILTDLNIPKNGRALILDQDGNIISADTEAEAPAGLPLPAFPLPEIREHLKKEAGKFTADYEGRAMLFHYRRSAPVPWFLLVGIPVDAVMASARAVLSLISITEIFLMTLLIVAIGAISNRLISSPLQRIVSVINRLEKGERTARVEVVSRDEFGLLGQELNKLLETVEEYAETMESKVRQRTEKLRRLQKENTRLRVVEERKRIYRDMHDSIGAKLTNIFFCNNVARSARRREPEKLEELFDDIEANCLDAVRNLKEIIGGLKEDRPTPENLAARLAAEIRSRLARNQVALVYRSRPSDAADALGAAAGAELAKVFDELVSNVLKHSGADRVSLSLVAKAGFLDIRFRDNGRGFDPQHARTSGSGLANIRFRVEQLGGSIEIVSRRERGTRYRISMPLVRAPQEATP